MPKVKTIEQLRGELAQKEKLVKKLQNRRGKVLARLGKIDRQMALLLGDEPAAGRGRAVAPAAKAPRGKRRGARQAQKLPAAIVQVLTAAGEPMRVRDVQKAVLKAGYKTHAKDFYGMAATALRDKKRFKKLKRGVYSLA